MDIIFGKTKNQTKTKQRKKKKNTIKHLKAKVCLILMEHEIRLNLCPEREISPNKYNNWFFFLAVLYLFSFLKDS